MEIASIAHILHINYKLNLLTSFKAVSDCLNEKSASDLSANQKIAFGHLNQLVESLMPA